MAALRARAEPLKGPRLEDWKRDTEPAVERRDGAPYQGWLKPRGTGPPGVGPTGSVISRLEDADYTGHSLAILRRIAAATGRRIIAHRTTRVEPAGGEG